MVIVIGEVHAGMNSRGRFTRLGFVAAAVLGGLLGASSIWLVYVAPTHAAQERYDAIYGRKCPTNGFSIKKQVEGGYDINAVYGHGGSTPGAPVTLEAIFDVICSADPEIDPDLALYFLKNGGRLDLSSLANIIAASKRGVKRDPFYGEILALIRDKLGLL